MDQAYRVLRVAFDAPRELEREYAANLAHGALFVPGDHELLHGEPVLALVDLVFAGASLPLEGRVAQTIPRGFAARGGTAGTAIALRDEPARIRTRLQQATGLPLPSPFERRREGRAAVRVVAHLRARLGLVAGRTIDGWTRNLSLAGVLVAISGEPPAVGEKVQVSIVHPTTGEARPIPGIIARHDVDQSGGVHGVGIRFLVCSQEAQATHEFLEQVKASEHARRLGAVTGSIDTLGLDDLLLSFGRCVPRGRFTLIGPDAVGTVHVADGRLVGAQVSDEIGVDALVRMSTWQSGRFEFHANVEAEAEERNLTLPVEAALLEAARRRDEQERSRGSEGPESLNMPARCAES